ncbi:hypothetical protein GPECTOR_119g405 [Gonium pectorale]|uniref:Peptidase C1A papain C-terminal domain-containing protein n=1 Tax=Gonium pectorale TaxID=33097 RepID=A0A150FYU4_GONPE|nr:hypothetical protein GPECTOR_119g405 [Gonium pectorale]|eukprot:KXZ42774.1 hypothetical protein GPECTOR_119g405 [Gonium pectorale]
MAPVFSVMDASDPSMSGCDGVYIAADGRTLAGLNPPASVSPSARINTETQYKNSRATAAAADRVAKELQAQGYNPRNLSSLPPDELRKAFASAKVPLAQEDKALGSYNYTQVLAALSCPTWDSRIGGSEATGYSYVSPAKEQGGCGSCIAFAAAAIAETAVAVAYDMRTNTNDFSEQWMFFCNGMYTPACTSGWYMREALDVLVQKSIPTEANYPYTAAPGTCALVSSPERRPNGAFSSVTLNDIELAKQHIREWGAVTTSFAVYTDFFNWLPPNPYKWDRISMLSGYHQVAVVGYNDSG